MHKWRQPIIIIGMHRSGTTMITDMLRRLDLFVGKDLEINSESEFFIRHNDWLLNQSGAAWDNPEPIRWFFEQKDVVSLSCEYLRARVGGFPAISYLGRKNFLAGSRMLSNMNMPWGWKDPRTTYTLPLWLQLFPDAKVIHIYRNGVPVAASLRARERKVLKQVRATYKARPATGWRQAKKLAGSFVGSCRCLSLAGGFSLWEEYLETALQMTDKVVPDAYTLKYEDFLSNPEQQLALLAEYCGLAPAASLVKQVACSVIAERGNAYLEDGELAEFYESVRGRPLMRSLGYDR
ncbi:MAG TPA: sulfotransferase [Gallionellaceae bacterium]|nr:sulfotransferase [Gallionellaceae bacterium]